MPVPGYPGLSGSNVHPCTYIPRGQILMWIFWALWVVIGLGIELWAALNRKKGDTLSEQVWWVNHWLVRYPALRIVAHFVLAGFLIILPGHFIYGWSL